MLHSNVRALENTMLCNETEAEALINIDNSLMMNSHSRQLCAFPKCNSQEFRCYNLINPFFGAVHRDCEWAPMLHVWIPKPHLRSQEPGLFLCRGIRWSEQVKGPLASCFSFLFPVSTYSLLPPTCKLINYLACGSIPVSIHPQAWQ